MTANETPIARPNRRRLQFSLRSLLLFVLIVGVPLSWLASQIKHIRDVRRAAATIRAGGGDVFYDYEMPDEEVPSRSGAQPPDGGWLRDVFGEELCADVVHVRLPLPSPGGPQLQDTEAAMAALSRFPKLRNLWLGPGHDCPDRLFTHLKAFSGLRVLALNETGITDAGLEHLAGLTELTNLSLSGCPINGDGLAHLVRLRNLRWLNLTQVRQLAVCYPGFYGVGG